MFARILCNVMMMRNLMMRVYDGGKNTFHFLFVLSSETRLEDKLLKRVRL